MEQPSDQPIEFSTKFIEEHLKELEQSLVDDEEFLIDEVSPKLNVKYKTKICKNLTPIEVMPPKPRSQIKRKPPENTQKYEPEKGYEFELNFIPTRLEAPPMEIPQDYGYEYMTDQLVDLVYQLTRLSVPSFSDDE
ncbi:hypothetical protein GPJ56_008965 [Histomonas meleagridis]|uniref:uncharacterized protein n=1 Tax=Histomonas meleagridis TaxID=135588 RepID=UPI003559A468|nr:hypothetical protein GPJ56_008965 [Histomonas meleagridis]KAH0805679.1 hypothetical protein GO595_001520 [Histomonas meleagridis]